MEKFNFGGELYVKERVAISQQAKIDKLEQEKRELVGTLSYYASFLSWTIDGHGFIEEAQDVNGGEWADRIRGDCDKLSDPGRGGYGGKRARQVLAKIKSEDKDA